MPELPRTPSDNVAETDWSDPWKATEKTRQEVGSTKTGDMAVERVERVSLHPLDPRDALRTLLRTPKD